MIHYAELVDNICTVCGNPLKHKSHLGHVIDKGDFYEYIEDTGEINRVDKVDSDYNSTFT